MPQHEAAPESLEQTTKHAVKGWTPPRQILLPGLTILAHPDPGRVGERVALQGVASGRSDALSRGEPGFAPPGGTRVRPLADPYLSRQPLVVEPGRAAGSLRLLRGACPITVDLDGAPLAAEREVDAEALARGVVLMLAERVVLLLHRFDPLAATHLPDYGLVGESPALVDLRHEIRRVAALSVPVFLSGESGTGKELVARAIHEAGPRKAGPYLAVNLGAIPPGLAAAELFGAVKGAFTGAERTRPGYFGRAQGGTLFLDEIGEASPELQALLLRAFESGEVQPVGGEEPRRADVRLIAATDADLRAAVARERFRAPLFYRLSGYQLELPPLRERRDDIGRLFFHFLRGQLEEIGAQGRLAPAAGDAAPWLPASLVARLAGQDWPGNVRQLRATARRLAVVGHELPQVPAAAIERVLRECSEPRAGAAAAAPAETPAETPAEAPPRRAARGYRPIKEVSDEELVAMLRANRWRLQPTAARLRISRTALYERIERMPGVRKASDVGLDELRDCLDRCGGDLDAAVEQLEVSKKGLLRRMSDLGLRQAR